MQRQSTVGSNLISNPKRETLRELLARTRVEASSQGGNEGAREALLFGVVPGRSESVATVLPADDPWSILGGGSTTAITGVPKSTLLEVVQRRRQGHKNPSVLVDVAGDLVDAIEDADGSRPQQHHAHVEVPATVKSKRRTAEDTMDAWATVHSGGHHNDQRATEKKARASVASTVFDLARPTMRDITHLLPLTSDAPAPQGCAVPDLLTNVTANAQRLVATRAKGADVFSRLDALVDDQQRSDRRQSGSGGAPRLDDMVDSACPFGEQALMFASAHPVTSSDAGGRRSGRGAHGQNITASTTIDRLNQSFDQWKRQIAAQQNSTGDAHHCFALKFRIDRLDASFGVVALVGTVLHVSDELSKQLSQITNGPTVAAELRSDWNGEQVVVVVDQTVYRNLGVLVGADVVVGNPCYVTAPAVGSSGLPIVIASFCISAASAEFLVGPAMQHSVVAPHGSGAMDGVEAAPFRYDPLQQRHTSDAGVQLVGDVSRGFDEDIAAHLDGIHNGSGTASRAAAKGAYTHVSGFPVGPAGMDWYVPVDLVMQLVAHREEQRRQAESELEVAYQDDDYELQLMPDHDEGANTFVVPLNDVCRTTVTASQHLAMGHDNPFRDQAQSTLSEGDFDDGFG